MKIQICRIENIKLILNPFNSLFFKAFGEFLYLTSFSTIPENVFTDLIAQVPSVP